MRTLETVCDRKKEFVCEHDGYCIVIPLSPLSPLWTVYAILVNRGNSLAGLAQSTTLERLSSFYHLIYIKFTTLFHLSLLKAFSQPINTDWLPSLYMYLSLFIPIYPKASLMPILPLKPNYSSPMFPSIFVTNRQNSLFLTGFLHQILTPKIFCALSVPW